MNRLVCLFLIFVFHCNLYAFEAVQVKSVSNDIHIAKSKAFISGMKHFSHEISNHLNTKLPLNNILVSELSEVFFIDEIYDENFENNIYSAKIKYGYNLDLLKHLYVKYGDKKILQNIYELLIIPIPKNNKVSCCDKWEQYKQELMAMRILYSSNINLGGKTFNEFISAFPGYLFKKVIIVEYDDQYQANFTYIDQFKTNKYNKKYQSLDELIEGVIDNYGNMKLYENFKINHKDIFSNTLKNNFSYFYIKGKTVSQIQKQIVSNLSRNKNISNILIQKTDNSKIYRLKISSTLTDKELFDILYKSGFSYKILNNKKFLERANK